jgi:hypothetical protein
MNIKYLSLLLAALIVGTARAEQQRPLFKKGESTVTFKLQDRDGKTPRIVLFQGADQAATADSINYWRDTQDLGCDGVAVDFKGIRFLQSKENPDELTVRLIGIKNELELGDAISLAELQSGKTQKLHFGPVAIGSIPISGTTDAEMVLRYDPRSRSLDIPEVSGQFEWKRLFYDAQSDAGSLTDVTGEVGDLPPGGQILKPVAK